MALFAPAGAESLLIGESRLGDYAVDEDVEMAVGDSRQGRPGVTMRAAGGKEWRLRAQVAHATPRAVMAEVKIARTGDTPVSPACGLLRKEGDWL